MYEPVTGRIVGIWGSQLPRPLRQPPPEFRPEHKGSSRQGFSDTEIHPLVPNFTREPGIGVPGERQESAESPGPDRLVVGNSPVQIREALCPESCAQRV